jgi:hypothetical protein
MTQQTAVEWLIEQLRSLSHSLEAHLGMGDIRVTQGMLDELEEKALQMEKEQSIAELRYKDGTPIRKHNSPKLQAIEMEISDEEIEKAAQETYPVKEEDSMSMPTRFDLDQYNRQIGFVAGIMWYRKQLKKENEV